MSLIQAAIRYLKGYVKIRVSGYSPERFLNLCSHHRIYLWGLRPCGNACEMYMTLKGFRKIRPIARKTRADVTLVRRYGLPFFLHRNRKRTLFVPGFLLCLLLVGLYSNCIWDIHFEGNEKWTDETLLAFLEETRVCPPMWKQKVNCGKIVKDIRKEYNDIVWVSASIEGSRLRIQIKENEDTFRETPEGTGQPENAGQQENTGQQRSTETAENQTGGNGSVEKPVDLVADTDGVITDMITRSGMPLVHVGDQVKKGDILVSGRIDVQNDSKETVGYQYVHADADIRAHTELPYEDRISAVYKKKEYKKYGQRYMCFLQIGNRRISIGAKKQNLKNRERYSKEWQLKAGENFSLPVSAGVMKVKAYTETEKKHSKTWIQRQLSGNFQRFCKDLEEKGIQIHEKSVKIHLNGNSASAEGILYLNRRIGTEADTEILEIERNESDEFIGTDNRDTGGT